MRGYGAGRYPGASNCWTVLPDENGQQGAALADGTAKASPLSVLLLHPIVFTEKNTDAA